MHLFFDTLNVTPYLGFAYNNMLIAYNYDSTQEFILENPSYSILAGANIEYVVIEKKLKLGLDTGFSYAMYKSVLPNSNTSLGHVNYSQYLVNITPSIQYNINSLLTVMGYYGFSVSLQEMLPHKVFIIQILMLIHLMSLITMVLSIPLD